MINKPFKDLMLDKDFIQKLVNQPTMEDAKKLFESEGLPMSDSEMGTLRLLLQKAINNSELTEEDLVKIVGAGKMEAKVVGGIIGAVLGACTVSPVAAKCGYHVGQAGGTAVGYITGENEQFNQGFGAGIGSSVGAVGGAALGAVGGVKLASWIVG